MFAAGLVIFLKKGWVIAVPFLKLRPPVAYRLTSELRLLREVTVRILTALDLGQSEDIET
jgi:hypothetical protein